MEFRQEGVVFVARIRTSLQDSGRPVPTAMQFHFPVAQSLSAVGGPDSAIVVNEIESCADGASRKPAAPEILRNIGGPVDDRALTFEDIPHLFKGICSVIGRRSPVALAVLKRAADAHFTCRPPRSTDQFEPATTFSAADPFTISSGGAGRADASSICHMCVEGWRTHAVCCGHVEGRCSCPFVRYGGVPAREDLGLRRSGRVGVGRVRRRLPCRRTAAAGPPPRRRRRRRVTSPTADSSSSRTTSAKCTSGFSATHAISISSASTRPTRTHSGTSTRCSGARTRSCRSSSCPSPAGS